MTQQEMRRLSLLSLLSGSVLLGCLATRFPKTTLEWDAAGLKVTNHSEANRLVRRRYRKGLHEMLAKALATCPDPRPAGPERIWDDVPDNGIS